VLRRQHHVSVGHPGQGHTGRDAGAVASSAVETDGASRNRRSVWPTRWAPEALKHHTCRASVDTRRSGREGTLLVAPLAESPHYRRCASVAGAGPGAPSSTAWGFQPSTGPARASIAPRRDSSPARHEGAAAACTLLRRLPGLRQASNTCSAPVDWRARSGASRDPGIDDVDADAVEVWHVTGR
jgi:hypothetical protein